MRHTLIIVCILLVIISSSVYAQQDWTTYQKNIVDDITAIAIEGDIIWLGTYNGLAKYNKITGKSIPFTEEHGLVNNEVNDIVVDNNGVKWIATNGGVSSFDGISFTSFSKQELGYTDILGAAVDRNNTKWFISHDAVLKYDDVSWYVYTLENGLPVGSLTTIAIDKTNTVWIGTNGKGIISFDGTEWILHEEYKKNIISIAIGEDNTKWFGDFKGSVISYDGESWDHFQVVSSMWFLYSLTVSSNNVIWASTNFGLYRVENGEKRLFNKENGMIESYCREIITDSNEDLWIDGYQGLTKFDGIIFSNLLCFTGPAANSICSIAVDHDNMKYLGHNDSIVSIFNDKRWSGFSNVEYENIGADIAVDKNNLKWITAYSDGILSYNDKKFELYKLFYTDAYGDVRTLYPRCVVIDHDNNIWVGTPGYDQEWPGYILKYNGIIFSLYIGNTIFIHYSDIISLTIDSKNNLWIRNGYGLYYYDGLSTNDIDEEGEHFYGIKKIYADRSDFIWGISKYGISRFDPNKHNWTTFTKDNSGLPTNNIFCIYADHNNIKWIGTDAGVCRFDGETWTTFTRSNSGLCDNKVNAIAVEKNNTIWFGTDNGVSRYTGEIITTSVDEEDETPEAIPVINTYPNPFNPSTTIEFTLPVSGFATLSIYNISGQKIRELAADYLTAGTHSLTWDGRDDSRNAVSSGIYITQLETGKHVKAGRMVLMR